MSWTLLRADGSRVELHEPDARSPRDLLLPSEVARVEAGNLVLEVDGAVLPLDAPLPPGRPLALRPPLDEHDNAALLFRVNAQGDRVRVDELLRIRAMQRDGIDPWPLPLATLRQQLAGWEARRVAAASFFADPAAQLAARANLGVQAGRSRSLFGLGRAP